MKIFVYTPARSRLRRAKLLLIPVRACFGGHTRSCPAQLISAFTLQLKAGSKAGQIIFADHYDLLCVLWLGKAADAERFSPSFNTQMIINGDAILQWLCMNSLELGRVHANRLCHAAKVSEYPATGRHSSSWIANLQSGSTAGNLQSRA